MWAIACVEGQFLPLGTRDGPVGCLAQWDCQGKVPIQAMIDTCVKPSGAAVDKVVNESVPSFGKATVTHTDNVSQAAVVIVCGGNAQIG